MRNYRVEAVSPVGSGQVGSIGSSRLTPMDMWDLYTTEIALERQLRRVEEASRRHKRQRNAFQAAVQLDPEQRKREREASRNRYRKSLELRHRQQYEVARQSFEHCDRLVRSGRHRSGEPQVLGELKSWDSFFKTSHLMDEHTFQRFTTWHCRLLKPANPKPDLSPVSPPTRPDPILLIARSRVQPRTPIPEEPSRFSIGSGIVRAQRPSDFQPSPRPSRRLLRILQGV